jgi:hypothetical protein
MVMVDIWHDKALKIVRQCAIPMSELDGSQAATIIIKKALIAAYEQGTKEKIDGKSD